jgi:hypothetical protein
MNNKEIKFRIWVRNDKAFTYFDVYEYPQGISGGTSEPMQYTGIKDVNDIELYEGDTVNCEISLGKDLSGAVAKYTGVIEFCDKFGHFGVKIDKTDKNVRTTEIPAPFGYFLNKEGKIVIEKTGDVYQK